MILTSGQAYGIYLLKIIVFYNHGLLNCFRAGCTSLPTLSGNNNWIVII